MMNDIPLQKKFKVSRSFARRTRNTFKVKNSRLASKRNTLAKFLESKTFMVGILVPTIYMLFIHDLIGSSGAAWTRSLSATVGAIDVIVFLIFLGEIICNIYAFRKSYTVTALFVLDLVALASLIPDILQYLFEVPVSTDLGQLTIARVTRTARVATRLARLPKLIDLLSCGDKGHDVAVNIEPSAIARRVEQRVSTKLVIAMLLLLTVTSLCNPGLDVAPHAKIALRELETVSIATNYSGPIYEQVHTVYMSNYQVLKLRIGDLTLVNNEKALKRTMEAYLLRVDTDVSNVVLLLKGEQQSLFALSIVQTVGTIIILVCACLFISRDLLLLVIRPIERMLSLIKKLTSTISAYSDSSYVHDDQSSSDEDEDGDDSNGGNIEFTESSMGSDTKETNLLEEFVEIITQEHMEQGAQRRLENQRRKMLLVVSTAIKGWLARRKYQKTLEMHYRREQVAGEVFSTERTYVGCLQVLNDVFMVPLRESGILEEDVINSIFLGLDPILKYNRDLLSKIEKQFEPWTVHSQLGKIFQAMEDLVDVYSGFVNNCTNAAALLTKYRDSNSKFAAFIEEQERHASCNHLNISALLIMPIQRAPRYYLLLEQLVKFTPHGHPDHAASITAIDAIKKATTMINERKRDAENRTVVQSIYIRLEPTVDVLMAHHCVFIREGLLVHEGDNYLFFLFNCVLLKCQPKDGGVRLVVVNEIPLSALCIVTPIADSPHFGLRHALQFESDTHKLLLSAPNQTSQADWVEALFNCIQKYKSNKRRDPSHTLRPPHNSSSPDMRAKREKMWTLSADGQQKAPSTPRRKTAALHKQASVIALHKQASTYYANNNNNE